MRASVWLVRRPGTSCTLDVKMFTLWLWMPTFFCWFLLFKWSIRQYFDINRNFYRYESPDESCYSESVSVGDVARQKKRRRRKADVEASSKVGTMLTMMMARCWWSRGGGKVENLLTCSAPLFKASSTISTSELVASSASLASMDPSQQEDYVASLRYLFTPLVSSVTIVLKTRGRSRHGRAIFSTWLC